jgi:hypothetical protein
MHRSTIGAISIDFPSRDVAAATAFWSAALGRSSRQGTRFPEFQVLEGRFGPMEGIVQDVGQTPPRVHLDLHTDDTEAEVARLIALGAREVARHDGWVVLEDPAGMPFCVCGVEGDDPVLEGAAAWDA